MIRRASGAVAVAATVLVGMLVAPGSAFAATSYFVATTGNDAAAGTAAAPFRTIQKCASVAIAGDSCQVASGTYRETVRPPASGTAAAPITFKAAPGATVTIDGTDAVSGWTLDSGSIYKAPVTLAGTAAAPYSSTIDPANADLWANQVFIGAAEVPEAAYPAPSSAPFGQTSVSGFSSTRSSGGDCLTTFPCPMLTGTLTYNSFPAFGDMTGAVAYFTGGWVALSAQITGGNLNGTNKTVNITFPQSDDNVYPGGGNAKRMRLIGKKAFLTGANQFFYDAGAKTLFLRTPSGAAPTNVFAKKRNYAFDLRDRDFVNVTGIGMHAATITTNAGSEGVVLDGVKGDHLSHWQTAQYDRNFLLAGIYDVNHRFDSGVVLHGKNNTIRNSFLEFSAGNGVNLQGSGHVVRNNLIRNVSYGGTYTAGVTLEVGTNTSSIVGNTMHEIGRDGINMNTNTYPNAGYKDNRIAYNNIYGYARAAFDLGGIYVCCNTSLAGTRIDHNWIHDPFNTGNGMHFDNGAYDVSVDHNAIWSLKSLGDVNHGGNGINHGGAPGAVVKPGLPYLRGSFTNNTIVAGLNYTIFNYFSPSSNVANATVRNNILDGFRPAGQQYAHISGGTPVASNNLVTSRSYDGTGTDPRYVDLGAGNLSIQTTSPAVNAGTAVPPLTDGFAGAAPDQGAYETGAARWVPGCDFTGCGASAGAFSTLLARHSSKVVDVNAAGAAVQATSSTASSQQWKLNLNAEGFYAIVNRASGNCLNVTGASTANGPVGQAACNGATNQQWRLTDAGSGYVRWVARHSGKCLDVTGASAADAALVVQYTCGTATNQQWQRPTVG